MLRIGGLTPYSATDYPGHFAAVVFCQGCPWRCRYCHNPHLLPAGTPPAVEWGDMMKFLERRQGLLDAVVFSGGEPTLQKDLEEAVHDVKAMGFKVGLHTAGIYPERLRRLLPLLDWVGMDIKMPFADYERLTGVTGSGAKARTSARWILESGVDYEFRTTVHSALLSRDALAALGRELAAMGVQHYVLQEFRQQGCQAFLPETAPAYLHCDTVEHMSQQFRRFSVRSA
ncbi:MAG: anaerobic ribonucleoside-triphosphate reductase activating protein [Betaproteobacteria bacterium]|nr:anaerobic ribonucleoside-triphosphate reductase activating protein [Betaproteobacteria bacterium]MDE2260325.1 anaerobic ribonucleoside-triphosphate reductase activating protein [Betaproteobacteria bacterium]